MKTPLPHSIVHDVVIGPKMEGYGYTPLLASDVEWLDDHVRRAFNTSFLLMTGVNRNEELLDKLR